MTIFSMSGIGNVSEMNNVVKTPGQQNNIIIPQGDVEDNPKDYAKSKRNKRTVAENKTIASENVALRKRISDLQATIQKLRVSGGRRTKATQLAKLVSDGRCAKATSIGPGKVQVIKPEGFLCLGDMESVVIPEETRLESLLRMSCDDDKTNRFISLMLQIVGSIRIMSLSKTRSEMLQAATSIMLLHVSPDFVEKARSLLDKHFFVPEGLVEVELSAVRGHLNSLRTSLVSLDTIPGYKMLKEMFSIILFFGMKPSSFIYSESSISRILEHVEKHVDISGMDVMLACLSISEKFIEVFETYVNGGELKSFILPSTIFNRVASLKAKRSFVENGSYEDVYHESPEVYKIELNSVITELTNELKRKDLNMTTKSIYQGYLVMTITMSEELRAKEQEFELRAKPCALMIYGDSDLGKTTVMNQAIATFGAATGMDVSRSKRWYMNEADKYDSDFTQDKNVVVVDDAANVKPDKIPANEQIGSRFITMINNIPAYSVQADADKKGKIQFKHAFVVASTNIPNINAHATSGKPFSILRRFTWMEVRVKPQFIRGEEDKRLDSSKAEVYENGVQVPLHEVRLYWWKESNDGQRIYEDWHPDGWICVSKAMTFLGNYWQKERSFQKVFVRRENRSHEVPRCSLCFQPRVSSWCLCPEVEKLTEAEMKEFWGKDYPEKPADIEPESSLIANYVLSSVLSQAVMYSSLWYVPKWVRNRLDNTAVSVAELVYLTYLDLINATLVETFVFLSGVIFVSGNLQYLLTSFITLLLATIYLFSEKADDKYKFRSMNLLVISALCLSFSLINIWFTLLILFCYVSFIMVSMVLFSKKVVKYEINRMIKSGIPYIKYGTAATLALTALCVMRKVWKGVKPLLVAQSDLQPTSDKEVDERHAKKNDWYKPEVARLDAPVCIKSMTFEQVTRKIRPHLLRFDISSDEKIVRGMGIAVSTSIILVPKHSVIQVISDSGLSFSFDTNPGVLSTRGTCNIIKHFCIPHTDFMLLQIDKMIPVSESFINFLPETNPGSMTVCEMQILREAGLIQQKIIFRPSARTSNGTDVIAHGSTHDVTIPTVAGDCMSPVISCTNPHLILGFHMGGNGDGIAACFTLLKGTLSKALSELRDMLPEGRIEKVDPGGWVEYQYPVEFHGLHNEKVIDKTPLYVLNEENHERAVVNFVDKNDDGKVPADCAIMGTDASARFQPRSSVAVTAFSGYLSNEGWVNIHGRPDFRFDRNHATYFQIGVRGISNIPRWILHHAMSDYVNGIFKMLDRVKYTPKLITPLTLQEALNGVPSTMWVRRIDEHTSAGPGLTKMKKEHLYTYFDNGVKCFSPKEYITTEVNDMYLKLKQGILVSPMVKTALKDEPTKLAAPGVLTKVRVFSVFPMSFFLVGKMLFGPILAVLYDFPLLSEMLQGVNTTTRQWDEVKNHILDFSPDMILEGDFSKFDVNLSGQLIRAAGSILVAVARYIGYNAADLLAVHTYVCDVAMNPWMYAGTVIVMDKWNPSGNYLTIALNGICNCLLHRSAWFSLKPDSTLGTFRDNVRLGTVGDDSIASTTNSWYNMRSLQAYFASINLPYTDGRKSPTVPQYFDSSNVVLCKRSFRYERRVDCFVAPLSIESIGRALHCKKKTYEDELTLTVQCVISQLRELARHEEELFYKYRDIISRAVDAYGISGLIREISYTYDDWWEILAKDFAYVPLYDEEIDEIDDISAISETSFNEV